MPVKNAQSIDSLNIYIDIPLKNKMFKFFKNLTVGQVLNATNLANRTSGQPLKDQIDLILVNEFIAQEKGISYEELSSLCPTTSESIFSHKETKDSYYLLHRLLSKHWRGQYVTPKREAGETLVNRSESSNTAPGIALPVLPSEQELLDGQNVSVSLNTSTSLNRVSGNKRKLENADLIAELLAVNKRILTELELLRSGQQIPNTVLPGLNSLETGEPQAKRNRFFSHLPPNSAPVLQTMEPGPEGMFNHVSESPFKLFKPLIISTNVNGSDRLDTSRISAPEV